MSNEDPPKGHWVVVETVIAAESRRSTVSASAGSAEALSLLTAASRAHLESSEFSLERAFADPANAEIKRMFILDEINRASPDAVSAWWWPELKQIVRELIEADSMILDKERLREEKAVTIANIVGYGFGHQGKRNARARAIQFYKTVQLVLDPPASPTPWTQRVLAKKKYLKDFWRF